jgi:TRAP-type transport system small permease protein
MRGHLLSPLGLEVYTMKRFLYYLNIFFNFYYKLLYFIIVLLVPFLIITVTYQVVARHIDFIPRFLWTEEVSRFTLIWLVMIGAALGVHNCDHFDIDLFTNLSSNKKNLRSIIIDLSIILSGLVFIIHGWQFTQSGLQRISLAARIPMAWIYGSFFFLGISIIIFKLQHILKYFNKTIDAK